MFAVTECASDQPLLFQLVRARRAGGRAGGFGPGDERERPASEQMFAEFLVQEPPGAHVLRLFLHPEHGNFIGVRIEDIFQHLVVQRIKLLDADDGHVIPFVLFAIRLQFVIDFPAADQNALHAGGRQGGRDDALEVSDDKLLAGRNDFRVAQQALGREHHQRLAPFAEHLPPQQVK